MADNYSTDSQQVIPKIETTPGTVETVDATNLKLEPEEIGGDPDFNRFPVDDIGPDISKAPDIISGEKYAFDLRYKFKASGTLGTPPAIGVFLRACGYKEQIVRQIDLAGPVAGGDAKFAEGEIVTDGSAKTAFVEQDTTSGTLRYIPITGGDFVDTDLIQSSTDSDSATAQGASSFYAIRYTPTTPNQETITLEKIMGSVGAAQPRFERARGVMGTGSISWDTHDIGRFSFQGQGVFDSHGEKAFISGHTLEEVAGADMAKLIDAVVQLNGQDVVPSNINFILGNQVILDPDPTAVGGGPAGYDRARILEREQSFELDPRTVPLSVFDELGLLRAGTVFPFRFESSGSSGHIIEIIAENCQIQGLQKGERNKLATFSPTLIATRRSVPDTEVKIYFK